MTTIITKNQKPKTENPQKIRNFANYFADT